MRDKFMRVLGQIAVIAFVAGCQTMPPEDASKSEISASTRAWAEAFNQCDAARISALYDRQAVVWATTAQEITSTPEAVRKYFDGVCASPTPPKVQLGASLIRVYRNTAIDSGSYTFQITREGKIIPVAARYTLAYRKVDNLWLIIEHHSSLRPAPPKP